MWNKECFGNVETNKKMALDEVEAQDRIEEGRSLTLKECKATKEAKESFKKWDLLNEMHWR